jgi:hypothetical protein
MCLDQGDHLVTREISGKLEKRSAIWRLDMNVSTLLQ